MTTAANPTEVASPGGRDAVTRRPAPPVVTVTDIISLPVETDDLVAHTIDCPRQGEQGSEYALSFGGWVLGRVAPPVAVEVVSLGRVVATSSVRLTRPGVTERYPDHPEPCGYAFRLGVLGLPRHFRLTMRAVLADGRTVVLGEVLGHHEPVASGASPLLLPLMVTSLGRMGTTWLMRLLSEHPAIVVHREYPYELMAGRYWMHQLRVLSAPFDVESSPDQDSLGGDPWRVGANPFYGPMLTAWPTLQQWLGRSQVDRLATFCRQSIDDFYGLVAQVQGQPRARFFAEKFLPDQLPDLAWELYPEAKEIFLVRDLRDAVCSMLAFNAKRGYESFGRSLVGSDNAFVRMVAGDMEILAEARRSRARLTHLVRYEDLIADPYQVLVGILDYIGLDHSPRVVSEMVERSSQDNADLVSHRTSGHPLASIGRWRRDLPPDLAEECTGAFARLLVEFGYEGVPT